MSDKHPCEHEDCPRTWCYRDAESWDYDNPVKIQRKPSGNTHFRIVLNRMEFEAVSQAAELRGLNVIEYIKRMAVEGNGSRPTTSGASTVTVWGAV